VTTNPGEIQRLKSAILLASFASSSLLGHAASLSAQEAGNDLTRVELEEMVAQRDAVIRDLLRRVEELERRTATLGTTPAPLPNGTGYVPVPAAPAGAEVAQPVALPPPDGAATARADANTTVAQAGESAPGTVEVDDDDIERALERTLVETGVVLLPFGQVEVEPSITYERSVQDFPVFVTENGDQLLANQELRRNEVTGRLALRVGLPIDSQLELDAPYQWVDQSAVTTVLGSPFSDDDSTGHAFGDIGVGLAATVLRERGYWPDLVARVRWDTPTGKMEDNGVGLGGGFNEITGQLVASKRQDPLVFVGSFSYETTFEKDGIDPGDELGFQLGTVLAASPDTALRFILDQRFGDEFEVDGETLSGSDTVQSTLFLGASSLLGRRVLLDVSAGVGLTDDAPDYSVAVALPIRFDLPLLY
jgi:Putative MetA-pathway of phenol degradation